VFLADVPLILWMSSIVYVLRSHSIENPNLFFALLNLDDVTRKKKKSLMLHAKVK
jgi:hypothetical protein